MVLLEYLTKKLGVKLVENMKAIFKAVTKYDFEDDKGKRVFGTNVWLDDLKPVVSDTAVGLVPKKISFSGNLDMFTKMKNYPTGATVSLIVDTVLGSRGVINKIIDFDLVK